MLIFDFLIRKDVELEVGGDPNRAREVRKNIKKICNRADQILYGTDACLELVPSDRKQSAISLPFRWVNPRPRNIEPANNKVLSEKQ